MIIATVNFGTSKSGLNTIGYTIYDSNNTIKQARTTVGIAEIGSSGIYRASIDLADGDLILWDTGEVSPRYAGEDYNADGGGGYYGGGIVYYGQPEFKPEEKIKLFELLLLQTELLTKLSAEVKSIKSNLPLQEKIQQDIEILGEALGTFMDFNKSGFDALAIGLCAILDNEEITEEIKETGDVLDGIIKSQDSFSDKITAFNKKVVALKTSKNKGGTNGK